MRDSFVMYTANIDQISLLNMEQRGNLFTAIMLYAADKELPQMDGMTQMAFSFIKAQLDRDNQKYQKMIESRREAGKLGGRPKGSASSDKPEEAKEYLTTRGYVVSAHEVMGVELEDKKGNLNQMLSILAEGKLNINYIYSFVIRDGRAPVMVFQTDDYEKATQILKKYNVKIVEEDDL